MRVSLRWFLKLRAGTILKGFAVRRSLSTLYSERSGIFPFVDPEFQQYNLLLLGYPVRKLMFFKYGWQRTIYYIIVSSILSIEFRTEIQYLIIEPISEINRENWSIWIHKIKGISKTDAKNPWMSNLRNLCSNKLNSLIKIFNLTTWEKRVKFVIEAHEIALAINIYPVDPQVEHRQAWSAISYTHIVIMLFRKIWGQV